MENIEIVNNKLNEHGFKSTIVKTGIEAKTLALQIIGEGSVGFGGSVTLEQIGLPENLIEQGNSFYWPWKDGPEMRRKAMSADFFLCSANAVTEDGKIIQTDGTGNRVAALCYGPKNVIMIVGKNKIVRDRRAGEMRIKSILCAGRNGKRLGLNTPCALVGMCPDCSSPQRMCSVTAVFERAPKGIENTYVILVDEELGY